MAAFMAGLWLIQRRTGDAGVVDVGWSLGIALLAAAFALVSTGPVERRALVAGLAVAWGVRLAWHIHARARRAGGEDPRYAALRERWGAAFQRNLFLFYQAQGLSQVALAVPVLAALAHRAPRLGAWDAAGAALAAVAIAGEALADAQLAAFRADPAHRGRTCRRGLWAWSRHPNYFFEWLFWWTWVAIAAPGPAAAWALVGPALMLWFLWKVTGIPTSEARALATRGEDYRDYQRTVSAFVPWPPRRAA
uniref:DUF1295 domain-containing protein n=1 Tax=Eiseniibacteriota bacterium TaxID=2212470 RepID=A0A832I4P1_UNCEI